MGLIISLTRQSKGKESLVDLPYPTGVLALHEEGIDIGRLAPVGTLAELAGDRHRPLLLEHAANLLLPQGSQKRRDPALAAAALEPNGGTPEEPQVVAWERLLQQLLDRSAEKLRGLQARDAALGIHPRGFV